MFPWILKYHNEFNNTIKIQTKYKDLNAIYPLSKIIFILQN